MGTFALVHGAWHGAWCWEDLVPELERLGHRAIAVELSCEDPDATFETYADRVVGALSDEDDQVVVVGHSLGGHTVPLVAARRPVARLVYVCALLAEPGRSLIDQLGDEPDMLLARYRDGIAADDLGRSSWTDFAVAREVFYADCEPDQARAAFNRLKPQGQRAHGVACPLAAHPDVPRSYVLCTEDAIVNPEWSRRAVPRLLGLEPVELPGSHSPFLSRPAELARLIAAG